MPSSHKIAEILACRVAKRCSAKVIPDLMAKRTVADVLETFELQVVPRKHKQEVKKQLAAYRKMPPHSLVSLKYVSNSVREYFPPLVMSDGYFDAGRTGKVILVDDLLSTGTTLKSARELVTSVGGTCSSAVCLLSDL